MNQTKANSALKVLSIEQLGLPSNNTDTQAQLSTMTTSSKDTPGQRPLKTKNTPQVDLQQGFYTRDGFGTDI